MSEHDRVQALLVEYTFGSLSEAKMIFVTSHLAGCDNCRATLQDYQSIVDALALMGPEVAPSPDLERHLMARVEEAMVDKPPASKDRFGLSNPARFWQHVRPVWVWASTILIIILGLTTLNLWRQLEATPIVTPNEPMQAIPLHSTNNTSDASGYILVSGDGQRGAVVVDDLPPLSVDHQYQLWLNRDGQGTSGAVFSVDDEGYGLSWISAPDSIFSYTDAGVSIEPVGGSPGPTGDKVLGCSLKK
ncbi:MAG: anti-sigma factor [Anaerolineaceae bacterium]|nr:anti-sigma factor [Anaerolineaceae bacterium]